MEANNFESTSEATPVRILSAAKDGSIYLWRILSNSEAGDDEDQLTYVADTMIRDEQLTRVKWLTSQTILVTTTHGNLYLLKIAKDD